VSGAVHRMRSDAALVRRFRAGDDSAFTALHARYAEPIRAYAAYMLRGTAHDADDTAQDVFLRAYQALRRDEREVDVRPWLYRVAHNRCIDALRLPVGAELQEEHVGAAGGGAAAGRDPAAAIEQREAMRALLRDIGGLTDGQRSALLLRELGGLSHEAVGEALGISPTSSRMLVHRARVALVDAAEARDTTCQEVRDRVIALTDGGARAKLARRDRRHLAACADCRAFRRAHAGVERELSLLAPAGFGLAGMVKLFGGGGAGAGAGAAAMGGGSAATTTVVSGTAAKLTVGACCALLAGGGAAVGVKEATEHHRPKDRAVVERRATRTTPPRATRGAAAAAVPPGAAVARPAAAATTTSTRAPAPAPAATHHARTTKTTPSTTQATTTPSSAPTRTIDLADLDGDATPTRRPATTTPAAEPAPEPRHVTTIDLADLGG
jgi:RNA polymerase sigma factor (sigma-70 family)